MRLASLVLSLLAHAALVAWAWFSMLTTPELKALEPEPVSVAIITPSEYLRLKKGSETAKELEAKAKEEPKPEQSRKEAEKPKPITAPEPPAAEPPPPEPPKPPEEAKPKEAPPPKPADPIADKLAALPPEPAPGPTPEELAKIEAEKKAAEEKAKAEEEKRKAEEAKKKAEEEKKKAEEKKRKDEERKKKLAAEKKRKEELEKKKKQEAADRLAALLDKDPTKKGAPLSATPPTSPTDYTGPTAGAREGNDTVFSARQIDILRGQISQQLRACWKLPGGGGGIETTVVTLAWRLRPDGSLESEPRIVQPQAGPVFQIAAEAAIRAVKGCSPFTLPPEMYDAWKVVEWDFDPREML